MRQILSAGRLSWTGLTGPYCTKAAHKTFSNLRRPKQDYKETFNVFLTEESHDRLIRLANTEDHRCSVRRLIFWGPLIEEDFVARMKGPYTIEEYTKDVGEAFDKQQLARGFAAHNRIVQEQKKLLDEEGAHDIWAASMSRLPQLEEVGFKYEDGNLDEQQASYIKAVEDTTLLKDQMGFTDSLTMEHHLGLVLQALAASGVKLRTLDFGRNWEDRVIIKDEFFGPDGYHRLSQEQMQAVFRPLKKLRLGLWTEAYHMMEWATEDTREVCPAPVIASLLQEMPHLEHLELVSSNDEADSPILEDVLSTSMPSLHDLAIEGFTLSGPKFISFLERHHALQSLKLDSIALEGAEWRTAFDTMRGLQHLQNVRFRRLNKWFQTDEAYFKGESNHAELESYIFGEGEWTANLSAYFDRSGLTRFRKWIYYMRLKRFITSKAPDV